ncbi:hypothetical protein ACJX0J_039309, partial [Zea mays]
IFFALDSFGKRKKIKYLGSKPLVQVEWKMEIFFAQGLNTPNMNKDLSNLKVPLKNKIFLWFLRCGFGVFCRWRLEIFVSTWSNGLVLGLVLGLIPEVVPRLLYPVDANSLYRKKCCLFSLLIHVLDLATSSFRKNLSTYITNNFKNKHYMIY